MLLIFLIHYFIQEGYINLIKGDKKDYFVCVMLQKVSISHTFQSIKIKFSIYQTILGKDWSIINQKCLFSNKQMRNISEESCDTED